jgi:hypothetical protein
MPNIDPLAGLTDFGLSRPSASSTVGNDNVNLDALLNNEMLDERGKANLLEEQLAKARLAETAAQEKGGLGDILKDPKVIAKLLGAIGLAAAGGGPGAVAGGALALGGLQKGQLDVEAERAQATAARKEVEDQLDTSLGRLDKMRNRIATAFNTNPEAFASPEGTAPDPRVLGWYMTGTDIPMFPMSRRTFENRSKQWESRVGVLEDALQKAQDPATRRKIMEHLAGQLNWNASSGIIDALANANPVDFDTTLAATLLREAGPSAIDAMIFAGENGIPLHDPRALRMLKFTDAGKNDLLPNQKLDARYAQLLVEMNDWANANPEQYGKMIEEAQDPEVGLSNLAAAAFAGRPGDQTLFLQKANLRGSGDFAELQAALSMWMSKSSVLQTLGVLDQIPDVQNMTPDELAVFNVQNAERLRDETKTAARATFANKVAAQRNTIVQTLVTELNAPPQAAYKAADQILKQAIQADEKKPGTFDETIEKLTKATIEANRK